VPPRVLLVLSVAIFAVSAAGVLVRLAPGAHPLALAFWRTAIVAVILAPAARRLPARDLLWIGLGGVFLALHFWAWFASLRLTTVLRSTVLVCLTPVWAGVGEAVLLREPPPVRFWVGVALALVGVAGLAGGGGSGGWTGDALALGGGVLSASYLLIGRSVRQRVDIATYGAAVCGAAALVLLALALPLHVELTHHSGTTWAAIAAMALGPQLLGHVGFNYAVRYVSAAVVGAVILLEPVGGTILAGVFLGERPVWTDGVAGATILAGVAIAVFTKPPPAPAPAVPGPGRADDRGGAPTG
jgi:drug/metabolite transporter (DMT)-like permease